MTPTQQVAFSAQRFIKGLPSEHGKRNFNPLQNFRSAESHIMFYAFDLLVRRGEP
jgi:hypothetical protein